MFYWGLPFCLNTRDLSSERAFLLILILLTLVISYISKTSNFIQIPQFISLMQPFQLPAELLSSTPVYSRLGMGSSSLSLPFPSPHLRREDYCLIPSLPLPFSPPPYKTSILLLCFQTALCKCPQLPHLCSNPHLHPKIFNILLACHCFHQPPFPWQPERSS